jgi:hypothetical protein
LIHPHYAQTAPIHIFRIRENLTVERIKESLAPGNPCPNTDEYHDSHGRGYATDIPPGAFATKEEKRKFIEMSLKNENTIIEFPDYFHTDTKKNKGGYIDLSKSVINNDKASCPKMHLAKPVSISYGKLKDKSGNHFAVAVADELWIYRINKIESSGLLDKEVSIIKIPADFAYLKKGSEYLSYVNKNGKVKKIVS